MSMRHLVATIGFVLIQSHLGILELTVIPEDAIVLEGESIEFRCTGNFLNWIYIDADDKYTDIYINDRLLRLFGENGFSIRGNRNLGEVNLFIENVTAGMAGAYFCGEEGRGSEDYASAQLIVLTNIPECSVTALSGDRSVLRPSRMPPHECRGWSSYSSSQNDSLRTPTSGQYEFIGPNTCGIAPDEISLSCSVEYVGRVAPVFELRLLKGNTVIKCSEGTSPTRLTCQVNMNATKNLNGEQFIWKTKQSDQKQYNYTTPPLNIHYAIGDNPSNSKTIESGNRVNCTAKCNHPIYYKWTLFEKTGQGGHKDFVCTRELVAKRDGVYTCEAMCQMGKHDVCEITVMQVHVSASSASKRVGEQETTDWRTIVLIMAAIAIPGIVGLVGALVRFLFRRRGRNYQSNNQPHENVNLADESSVQSPLNQTLNETQPSENETTQLASSH